METIARLGAKLILQQTLESEVELFLGRARYERAEERVAYRNGYEPKTVETTSGPLELERPRPRGASELGFSSAVLDKEVTRTHALEALVVLSFLRGLSVRDVEGLLEETFGARVLSKSTVSRICEQTRERYLAWCERDLSEHDVVYCFLDAISLKLRPDDEPAEGVLCAWGLTLEGRKVLLGVQLGSRESYEDWLDFARDLTARGLRSPALVVADGAPGLWKALSEAWPAALGQRCTVHKLRYLLCKLPERLHREVKARYWAALDEATSPAQAKAALQALASDYRAACPSFARSLADDLDALVCHLRFPSAHRTRIRSTDENVKRSGGACGLALGRWIGRGGCSQGLRSPPVASVQRARARNAGFRARGASPASRRRRCRRAQLALRFGVGVADPGAKRRSWG